jgi:dTDP-4-dehydrorhamnose reductase
MKNDNILILGNGYLANRVKEENGWEICADKINGYDDLENIFKKHKPEVIVCAIGFTGRPNTDNCEQNIEKTISSNTFIPVYLAELSFRHPEVHIISIASGCIFNDSDKAYTEEDIGNYEGLFYSRSKIYAEEILKYPVRLGRKISICRIRIPIDYIPSPRNVLDKLINYKTILDIPNSITYVPTLCRGLDFIVKHNVYGVINLVNEGTIRYPKLLDEYKKYVPDFQYKITDLKTIGVKRTNLELVPSVKLKKLGFKNENINDLIPIIVKKYMEEMKTNKLSL